MIEVLKIIAGSWPIAIMVLGAMGGFIALYILHWRKQLDLEDKAYRASQAVVIRNRDNAG